MILGSLILLLTPNSGSALHPYRTLPNCISLFRYFCE